MKHHSDLSIKGFCPASEFGAAAFAILAAFVFPAFLFLSCGREEMQSAESAGIEVKQVQTEQAGTEDVPSNPVPGLPEEPRPVSVVSVADPAPSDAPSAEKKMTSVTETELRKIKPVESSYIPKRVYSSGMEFEYVYYDGSPTPIPASVTKIYPGAFDGAGCEQYVREYYGHLMKLILGEDYFI